MKDRNFSRLFYLLVVLVLSGGLLSACDLQNRADAQTPSETQVQDQPVQQQGVIVEGNLVPKEFSRMVFMQGGEISEILVEEGDNVSQGTVLVRLANQEQVEASVTAAELELLDSQQALDQLNETVDLSRGQAQDDLVAAELYLVEAQRELDEVDTDDFEQRLDDAWVDVKEAEDEVEDAQEELDKYLNLDSNNTTRTQAEDDLEAAEDNYDEVLWTYKEMKSERDSVRAKVAIAEARLADAQRAYDDLQNGPDPDDLALAEARVRNAEAQLASAQAALRDTVLVAPYDGRVVEVNVAVGDNVSPNQPVLLIADFSEWYVETSDLTEMEVVRINDGGTVWVVPDALPDLELRGVIERISESYQERAGDVVYTARILLPETDPRLRWGMTTQVTFEELE